MTKQRRHTAPTTELDEQIRQTVIPTPRTNAIFNGWGVRF